MSTAVTLASWVVPCPASPGLSAGGATVMPTVSLIDPNEVRRRLGAYARPE